MAFSASLGSVNNGIDCSFDIADRTLNIDFRVKLNRNGGDPIARGRFKLFDTVNKAHFRLNGGNDIFIDILRRSARPNDPNIDVFDLGGRKKLSVQSGKAENAEHNHRQEKQIGGIAMPRKQFNSRRHRPHLRRIHYFYGNARGRLIEARHQYHIAFVQTAFQQNLRPVIDEIVDRAGYQAPVFNR